MRQNQAVAGAVVAALLAYFDVVGFARCVAYLWPSLGPTGLVLPLPLRFKFKNASPAARAGLPRISFAPYEFVGGDSVGLVFYPGAAVEAAAYAPLCRRVAEEAKATVILARPPFRMVITTRGFRQLTARHPSIKTWATGGHSSFTPSTRLDASHRGFGDYGIQAHDGERTISLEDQQDQVARHLVSFLGRVGKRG